MNPVLELKDLHVTLRQHRRTTELVKGVSFAVEPGECLGILGESGSGKSMSMKAAMGLLDKGFSVSGAAMFQGEPLFKKSGEELRRLPKRDRTILHLYYYEEMSTAEIARVLGKREGSIRTRLSRARKMLRQILSETEGDAYV